MVRSETTRFVRELLVAAEHVRRATRRSDDPYADNRRAWDERARVHRDTPLYRAYIQQLCDGGDALLPHDDRVLGDLAGLDVLHLQCHIGADTLSLARRGANVVGIDFSEDAIVQARKLGQELSFCPRHPGMEKNADRTWRLPERHHGRIAVKKVHLRKTRG